MDLKAAYDAVVSAREEAVAVAQEIESLFEAGNTDEALSLRPQWEEAKAKAEELAELYNDMAGFSEEKVAKKFVPAAQPKQEEKEDKKVIDRASFDELTPAEKMAYIKDGGKIIDVGMDLERFRVKSLVVDAIRGSFLASIVGDKKGVIVPFTMVQSVGDVVLIKHITPSSVDAEAEEERPTDY